MTARERVYRAIFLNEGNGRGFLMEILTPQEVSKLLKKSVRWVYANGDTLGGVKIGGSWIFTKENLTDAIQRKRQMAGGGYDPGQKIHGPVVNQKGGGKLGAGQTREIQEAARRHNLVEFLHEVS
jgi:hypothetical protein